MKLEHFALKVVIFCTIFQLLVMPNGYYYLNKIKEIFYQILL